MQGHRANMRLILTPLVNSLQSLDLALKEYARDQRNLFVRDSCIQRFEYTYELSWKFIKRYLMASEPGETKIEELSFESLIRLASDRGLLKHGWDKWKFYRQARNDTSHTYNEDKALSVLQQLPDFYLDAAHLLKQLSARNE